MKSRLAALCCFLGLWTIPFDALAAEVFGTSTINWMQTYQAIQGVWTAHDTIFVLTNGSAGTCVGFWLSPDNDGYQANLATLLAAKLAERPVTVYALDTQTWSGSTDNFCRVSAIRLP